MRGFRPRLSGSMRAGRVRLRRAMGSWTVLLGTERIAAGSPTPSPKKIRLPGVCTTCWGNVFEWCSDRWEDNYSVPKSGVRVDPQGPEKGDYRVIRGGGWDDSARYVRAAYRSGLEPGLRLSDLGFRFARGQMLAGSASRKAEASETRPQARLREAVEQGPYRTSASNGTPHIITQPKTQPRVMCPPWASDAGRDEFGVWARVDFPKTKSASFRMRYIEPGTFLMGSPEDEEGRQLTEGPQHEVRHTEGFWLSETQCTQATWKAVMRNNPSHFKGDEQPVESVNWNYCQKFLKALNIRVPGLEARLPTEAQWEFACRGGTTWAYYGKLDHIAWYRENSGRKPHPVAQKDPNAWGLYDMSGNVWELCSDWWGEYSVSVGYARVDPQGPQGGAKRVIRGGAWDRPAHLQRSAFRGTVEPTWGNNDLGFQTLSRSGVKYIKSEQPAREWGVDSPEQSLGQASK